MASISGNFIDRLGRHIVSNFAQYKAVLKMALINRENIAADLTPTSDSNLMFR